MLIFEILLDLSRDVEQIVGYINSEFQVSEIKLRIVYKLLIYSWYFKLQNWIRFIKEKLEKG